MTNARIFWIIWCSMWALFWLLAGFFTFLVGWLLVPVSLLAILIPVGGGGAPPKYIRFPGGRPPSQPPWQPPWQSPAPQGPPPPLASPPGAAPAGWPPPAPPAAVPGPPPGWYPDPQGQPRMRWWDGHTWAP